MSATYQPAPAVLLPISGFFLALAFHALRTKAARTLWTVFFLLAALVLFWAHGIIHRPAEGETAGKQLPAREARLVLRVEREFHSPGSHDSIGGIAEVVSAPPHARIAKASRVCFRIGVKDPEVAFRGRTILAKGVLTAMPPRAEGASEFGFHDYLRSTGVWHLFDRGEMISEVAPPPAQIRFFQLLEERFVRILSLDEPEDPGPGTVYRAMLLGRKGELDPERRAGYRDTGTLHLFAISGLHIAVVAAVLGFILSIARLPAQLRPLVALPLLYAYVQAVGAPPSAVRAFLMALFFWLGTGLRRQRSPVAALAASATFVLFLDPSQFGNPGFQLSYCVVLSILLFGLPLHAATSDRLIPFREVPERELKRWEAHSNAFARSGLLLVTVGISAWLASAPLCATYFSVVAPSGILLNLLLVHLASLVIVTGVLSLLTGLAGLEALAGFLNNAAWIVISGMDGLVAAASKLPGSGIQCHLPASWACASLAVFFGILATAHARRTEQEPFWLGSATLALILLLALGLASG